jgi:hypothetical protein
MMTNMRRAAGLMSVLAMVALAGCSEQRVEDETPPGVRTQADTMAVDTLLPPPPPVPSPADTMGNPPDTT